MERKYSSSHFPLTPVLLLLREMATLTDVLSVSARTGGLHGCFILNQRTWDRWEEDGQATCGETDKAPTGTIDPEQWPGEGRQVEEHPGGTCSC